MNKSLHFAHWLLVIIAIVGLIATVQTSITLWQANKINHFIENISDYEQVPDHSMAQFAQAYSEAEQDKPQQALDRLTQIITTDAVNLRATAYYNRANIHLRQAQLLVKGDKKHIPLVELAKQDYRNALLLVPELWDARFNLELALRMVPEDPDVDPFFDKPTVLNELTVESFGFKVDLP